MVRLYLTLQTSAMLDLYDETDVQMAYIACDLLHRALTETLRTTGGTNTALIQAALSALESLGVTEGDRRRLRIESERTSRDEAEIIRIQQGYRRIKEQS